MISFTKEQLIASAHARIEFAEMMLAGELEPLKERTWSIELELARIALASLEAEAVCVIDQSNLDYLKSGSDADVWPASRTEMGDVLLYRAAPPAPVSVPEEVASAIESLKQTLVECNRYNYCFDAVKRVEDACRAAMLQGAEPVTTAYKLPEPIKDNRLNSGAEADDYYSGYQAGWNELLEAVSGNSPVIPDGWVMLPAEPTQAMMNAWLSEVANWRGHAAGYRAMIAAAPQQEDK